MTLPGQQLHQQPPASHVRKLESPAGSANGGPVAASDTKLTSLPFRQTATAASGQHATAIISLTDAADASLEDGSSDAAAEEAAVAALLLDLRNPVAGAGLAACHAPPKLLLRWQQTTLPMQQRRPCRSCLAGEGFRRDALRNLRCCTSQELCKARP